MKSLEDTVQDYKKKEKERSNGWIGALVASLVVILVTGILGYLSWRKGKKLAQLLHEKAIEEEKAFSAKVDEQIAELEEERQQAQERILEASTKLEELQKQEEELVRDYNDAQARIKDLVTWDDIDSYLRSKSRKAKYTHATYGVDTYSSKRGKPTK